jgi:hypothetical protein
MEVAGIKVTNLKTALGSSLCEDAELRDSNDFFCDIQRYVSYDQAYYKLLGDKD